MCLRSEFVFLSLYNLKYGHFIISNVESKTHVIELYFYLFLLKQTFMMQNIITQMLCNNIILLKYCKSVNLSHDFSSFIIIFIYTSYEL